MDRPVIPGIRRAALAVTAVVLCLGLVTPAIASAGPTRLSDPTVSDRTATTQTPITFTVGYRNREGSAADWVRVRIGGTVHPMSRTSSEAWKSGVTFSWRGTLPAGNHASLFEAMSRDRFGDTLAAGTVSITVPPTLRPTPTPRSTPGATAQPTPRPTTEPSATPRPTATATATARPTPTVTPRPTNPTSTPRPTVAATPRPTAPADAVPTGAPTPSASATAPTAPGSAPTGSTRPSGDPSWTPAPTTTATASPGAPDSGPGPSPRHSDGAVAIVAGGGGTTASNAGPDLSSQQGGSGPGRTTAIDPGPGSGFAALGALAFGRPATSELGLLLTLATTSTVVGATFALSLFGKRRRDGEPPAPDEVLAGYAAAGVAVVTAGLSGNGRDRGQRATPPASEDELAMPRWRRPSLLEARKADPVRNVVAPQRLTFDHGLVGPLDGHERRLIGYSLVRLLDRPDELRGTEIGFVDQGDEVQLLEKSGVYWLVLCPDGRQGWLHKMTLGERAGQTAGEDPAGPSSRRQATATMPQAAETWTMGEDIDGDILAAYLEHRRRD